MNDVIPLQIEEEDSEHPLTQVLPSNFPLQTLLTFLPDVELKRELDDRAAEALGIDVTEEAGLEAADTELNALKVMVKDREERFQVPISIAHQLHKRLTGLRAEWLKAANDAIDKLTTRIKKEARRREQLQEAERAAAQARADAAARDAANQAAMKAVAAGASPATVKKLQEQAATAQAPPVSSPVRGPQLSSGLAARWKARLLGTGDSDNPNPDMAELSPIQQESALQLMRAVLEGNEPLTCFSINWSLLNKRATGEKRTLRIPGIEAFDAGSLRRKS